MKKIILFSLTFLALVGMYAIYQFNYQQQTTQDTRQDLIIVGTSADYPPYEKIDLVTGKIVGFDIDVINEIAHRLGKKIVLKDMPFNSLMVSLASGQIDLVAAGLSEIEERKHAVLFSHVYLDKDYMVIVTKASTPWLHTLADLYGKTVAVNTGYNADTYLSTLPEIKLVRLDSAADSALALQSHSVDAFATSKSIYTMFIQQQDRPEQYQSFIIPAQAEQCAFAFVKNNHTLKQDIDTALAAMKQDGTLAKIQKDWGFDD